MATTGTGGTPSLAFLVRHAAAQPRSAWSGPNVTRPLDGAGLRQAELLALRLAGRGPGGERLVRVLTSPAVRCRQTVVPTAARAGLELEECDALAEGSDPLDALGVVLAAADGAGPGGAVAACTHGDVIDGILETFALAGIPVEGPLAGPKAVTWELTVSGGELVAARFVAPPR